MVLNMDVHNVQTLRIHVSIVGWVYCDPLPMPATVIDLLCPGKGTLSPPARARHQAAAQQTFSLCVVGDLDNINSHQKCRSALW